MFKQCDVQLNKKVEDVWLHFERTRFLLSLHLSKKNPALALSIYGSKRLGWGKGEKSS